ncbi:MAG: outer membrane protein assembly factor BamE [Lonepinella koalarum]|nr:outer membrane protein assembly factor BamE [Lonepinella koalarum]
MKFKTLLPTLLLAFGITACSSVNKVVYRIDVPQGNYLDSSTVNQVKIGMNAEQVQYLLGTPVLKNPYGKLRWYYVFLQQYSYEDPVQHTFVVDFDQRGIVTNVSLDKPLNDTEKTHVNNAIIDAPEPKKRWWKF